jgi:hypothetical protein
MADQGRNTNFVAVSLIGHGALVARATIWNQTELLAVLAPWPLLRVFFLHGSVKPGVLTATQPQDASEVSDQHFDFLRDRAGLQQNTLGAMSTLKGSKNCGIVCLASTIQLRSKS